MKIQVAYALAHRQLVIELDVPVGVTARTAVLTSGLECEFPELDLVVVPIGVFGERVDDDTCLHDGDRVEVYRPLQLDPMEARRRRAAQSRGIIPTR